VLDWIAQASKGSSSDGDREAMDRILFGDNQFFGVNHMSEEKAASS
jgi:hypothetical protein